MVHAAKSGRNNQVAACKIQAGFWQREPTNENQLVFACFTGHSCINVILETDILGLYRVHWYIL